MGRDRKTALPANSVHMYGRGASPVLLRVVLIFAAEVTSMVGTDGGQQGGAYILASRERSAGLQGMTDGGR